MSHDRNRLGILLPPLLMAAVLAGCVGVEPSQPVTSEAQAIRVARERCAWTRPFDANEQWHARLHESQWHVWLVRDRDPREPVVGALDIWIRAGDGGAGSCNRAP
jgi:hypothetical protein